MNNGDIFSILVSLIDEVTKQAQQEEQAAAESKERRVSAGDVVSDGEPLKSFSQLKSEETPTFIQRMEDELTQLMESRVKLEKFVESEQADSLTTIERELLIEQHSAMVEYEHALFRRVELYTTFRRISG